MRARRQAGQNLVELALGMTVLLWVVLGVLDFGRVMYIYTGLTSGAREGARYAALLSTTQCTAAMTDIKAVVRAEQTNLFTNTDLTDTTGTYQPVITIDCAQADRRTVTVKYWFKPVTFFIADALDSPNGSRRIPLTTWATMPLTPS
jgi:Flp pilus assembly protein TadG